ncbi:hypothetical protein QVD17_17511 [Tagetes erecta]|uniref:Tetratricopeptide repeat-like superfamily protein n=1 Tax=Tagetes erecta TaxID=13708 RepID=A0AAD8P1I4_TARER|nr:hypothetical protein QVD17_17511 [Tagetes erecta]
MGVKVPATGCLNWSSSSQNSLKRRSLTDVSFVCRYVHRSSVFGNNKLIRSRSCETLTLKLSRPKKPIKRIVSATFDSEYADDELANEIRELALRFQFSRDDSENESELASRDLEDSNQFLVREESLTRNWFGDMIPASIERKANSVGLPFSLRIIQRKKQLEEGFREAGEFAYCSMKKAFSSMVFIIRELQSYTLQMREVLFVEDLHDILMRVQKEMNASFVWLFQQVFSHTPNLMVCVMILLANYSVYSMSVNVAEVATPPVSATVEFVSDSTVADPKFDFSPSGGKTSLIIGGINGGGGNFRPISSGTDGDGNFDEFVEHQAIVSDGASSSTVNPTDSTDPTSTNEESVSVEVNEVEELGLWKSVVAEAEEMREVIGDDGLDSETMRMFVSPVTVKIDEEVAGEDYLKTELHYQTGLVKEPDNPLLLANYAQFLYIFSNDHKRAEVYFKKASEIEPKDAEALCKYAIFLWHAKKDLWAAEEAFLEAISANPNNSYYSGTYANFLWSNGASETCFPIHSSENVNSDEV